MPPINPRLLPGSVRAYLGRYVRRRRAVSLAAALGWATAWSIAWTVSLRTATGWLSLNPSIQQTGRIAGGVVCIAILARPVIFLFRRYNPVTAAMEIERRAPIFDERLITAASLPDHSPLINQLVSEVESLARRVQNARLVPLRPLLGPALAVLAALLLLVLPIEKKTAAGPSPASLGIKSER